MTTQQAKEETKQYRDKAKADGDSYLIVHFSKEQDHYGAYQKLDAGDAMIVIKELANHFDIDLNILAFQMPMEKIAEDE